MNTDKLRRGFKKYWAQYKRWFFTKPKTGFWAYAFWISILFRYVIPSLVMIMVFLQMGLVTPHQDAGYVNRTMERAADNMADAYVGVMHRMYNTGQKISLANPTIGMVTFHAISAAIYAIWAGMLVVCTTLLRYFLAWFIKKALPWLRRRRR